MTKKATMKRKPRVQPTKPKAVEGEGLKSQGITWGRQRQARSLTAQELVIARGAAMGWSNREIAARLTVSEKTVEAHRSNIYRKCDVHNTAQLIQWLLRAGLLTATELVA